MAAVISALWKANLVLDVALGMQFATEADVSVVTWIKMENVCE